MTCHFRKKVFGRKAKVIGHFINMIKIVFCSVFAAFNVCDKSSFNYSEII